MLNHSTHVRKARHGCKESCDSGLFTLTHVSSPVGKALGRRTEEVLQFPYSDARNIPGLVLVTVGMGRNVISDFKWCVNMLWSAAWNDKLA